MVPRRVWFGVMAAVILTLGAMVAPSLYTTAILGSGFLAQLLCSSTFVSHRDPQSIVAEDMSGPGFELVRLFEWRVERDRKRAIASMLGLGRRTAIFREGLGCTLVVDTGEDEQRAQAGGVFPAEPASNRKAPWPTGDRVDLEAPSQIDTQRSMLRLRVPSPSPREPRSTWLGDRRSRQR